LWKVEQDDKGPEQPESGPEDPDGPEDEYEALRADLLIQMRRRPADRGSLLRHAESLSRIMAAQHRMSPKPTKDLSDNLAAVLNRFGDLIVPPDS